MKVELEVSYDPARNGLVLFISRTTLLHWMAEAFQLNAVAMPEVEPPDDPPAVLDTLPGRD